MRFKIVYDASQFNQGFAGLGSVTLTDSTVIFSGYRSKFPIPILMLLFSGIYSHLGLMLVPTICTIPYGVITSYTRRLSAYHRVMYTLPDGDKKLFSFILAENDQTLFSTRLEENRTAIRTLYTRISTP